MTYPRSRALLLATVVLLGGATSAQATVSVSISGGELIVTGSAGADAPRFTFYTGAVDGPNYTRIFDDGGVTDLPDSCTRTDVDPISQPPEKVAVCPDGGTAPLLTSLTLELLGGNDEPLLEECFDTVTANLGEGANRPRVPACGGGSFAVTTGSGEDRLITDDNSAVSVTADLGAGADEAYGANEGGTGSMIIHGGPGNDYLSGGDGNDQLFGDGGNDMVHGNGGNDVLDGGDGDDQLDYSHGVSHDEDPGSDEYRGGAGTDKVFLSGHTSGMTISLDDVANDGGPGEGDNFRSDLEDIEGTPKNDTYSGSSGPDRFDGGPGDDVIHGGPGDDELFGGSGQDQVFGDAGNDRLLGDYGDDVIDGGPGADSLFGDLANCSVYACPAYNDTILARDGEGDSVQCGAGADSAVVDAIDVVAQDGLQACESVDRPPATTPPAPTPTPPAPTPSPSPSPSPGLPTVVAVALTSGAKPSIAKGVRVTVKCPAACTFTVTIRLSAKAARRYGLGRKALTIATGRGALLQAGSKTLRVKLTTKARRRLKRARTVPATLRVSAANAAGTKTVKSRTIALKP